MQSSGPVRCLILACGNPLRGDDGIGPWLARWAEEQFPGDPAVRVISRQQWTPELAEEIARAESVVFIDSSIDSAPGEIQSLAVEPAPPEPGLATHHLDAPRLLALCQELFGRLPRSAQILTVGAGSTEMGETLSPEAEAALPEACAWLMRAIATGFIEQRS